MVFIIMGVSGSGKTTIGKLLAQKLQLPFYDADDFHTSGNISKMQNSIPLSDDDRKGWLKNLSGQIFKWENEGGAVLACSALKEKYRAALASIPQSHIQWVYLKASPSLIKERLSERENHFMSPGLLNSQFETLEEPAYGIQMQVDDTPEVVVAKILKELG